MLTEIFCALDDFCNTLPQKDLCLPSKNGVKPRHRKGKLSLSEMSTIMVMFHLSHAKNFKHFYLENVCRHMKEDFPGLISYARFVRKMPTLCHVLALFLMKNRGRNTGISFVDSTSIKVCHNKRINRNKTFKGLAARGKSTMGWFYGFKLHLIINDQGEIQGLSLTKGNVDDRKPVPKMARQLWGKLFGDKGYLSKKLFQTLFAQGLQLITNIRSNMKSKLVDFADKLLLRRRFLIETVNDQLKNEMEIEHTRHRSPSNFMTNLISGLVAYGFKTKKPSLRYRSKYNELLAA